jgi:hypothetical protein
MTARSSLDSAVNVNPGWGALTAELNLASSLRTLKRHAGREIANRALFHLGYLHFDNRWLNIATRTLAPAAPGRKLEAIDEAGAIAAIPGQHRVAASRRRGSSGP